MPETSTICGASVNPANEDDAPARSASRAFCKSFPNDVGRDPNFSAGAFLALAYRSTFVRRYHLRQEVLRALVSEGLGETAAERAIAECRARGYLKRRQVGGPGKRFGKVQEELCLPSGEGRPIYRAWFDGSLSRDAFAALLFMYIGTGKGERTYAREVQQRFKWSRPKTHEIIGRLEERGLVEELKRRDERGRFVDKTYAVPELSRTCLAPSTVKNPRNDSPRHGGLRDILSDPPTQDSPLRTESNTQRPPVRVYASFASREPAPTLAELHAEAHRSTKLLGWVRIDAGVGAVLEWVNSDVVAEITAAVPDDELRKLVFDATGERVADEITSPAGLYAIRYLAGALLQPGEQPEHALHPVLEAMRNSVGSRPGARLNSLKLIGMRIAGELLGSGRDSLYAGSAPAAPDTDDDHLWRMILADSAYASTAQMLEALVEADGAKALAPKLRRDREGLKQFVAKQPPLPVDDILAVMTIVLWRHMPFDFKPVGSIRSWEYFAAAIADEVRAREMEQLGVRPGDAPAWRGADV